jgi:hypothetical protein
MSTPTIPQELAKLYWPNLLPNERLLWRGKPVRGAFIRRNPKFTLQSIPIALFISFWMWGVISFIPRKGKPFSDFESTIPWAFVAFGMLFVAQALYLLFGHYIRSWVEWKNIEYAVTNHRLVFRGGVLEVREWSLPLTSLGEGVEVRGLRPGDIGDVIFQRPEKGNEAKGFPDLIKQIFNPERQNEGLGFYAVEHVHDIYRHILGAAADLRK